MCVRLSKAQAPSLTLNIAFPPSRPSARQDAAPEIKDPWEGPRTYAEDFYSGGDMPLVRGSRLDPHNLENEPPTEQLGDEGM